MRLLPGLRLARVRPVADSQRQRAGARSDADMDAGAVADVAVDAEAAVGGR